MVQMTPGITLDVLKLSVAIHFGFAHLDEDKQQKTRAYLRSKSAWALSKQVLAYVVRELQQAPGGAGLVSAIRNAQRVQGSDAVTRLDGMGRVVPRVLVLLQTHGGVLDTIAAEDAPGFRRLAQAVKSRDAHTVLRALARIPGAAPSLTWISSTVRRIAQVVTSDDLTAEEKAAVSAEEARRAATGIQQARLAESATDPLTPRGADAAEQRVSAETVALDVTSDEHAADPHTARAAVARAEVQSTGHATETGRKLGLSPEQEHAMIDTGQVLIAAGAGSGKTRVLAGKVVYHLRDKKEPARSLIATSFTRKSARELKERIQSYGGADVLDGAEGYVGTTHSVSMAVQRDYGPRNRPDIASDGLQRATVEIAIKQVQMNPTSGFAAPPSTTRPFLDELTPVTGAGGRGADRDRGTSRFWKEPANQWWNLGLKKIVDEKGNAAGVRQVATAISKWKGNLVSPSEAWKESGESPLAAVYAAYEWLKRNDAPWAGKQDKDDILTEGVRLLARNKGAREAVQHRFKTVLVDEAQDQNRAQNVLFGLVTGTHNPDTLQEYPDGRMTAKTYCKIGDDKQCCHLDTELQTPSGTSRARDLHDGAEVLAYRNGKKVFQTVRVRPSSWKHGYRIETASGRHLTISPNHKIWASRPILKAGQVMVYLMYREDLGFRVGITNKGVASKRYTDSFGGRAFLEKAERMWFLKICADREEALLEEEVVSLTYGIPTCVFNGAHRGLNQDRLAEVFRRFGRNGARVLDAYGYSFDLPHWSSVAYAKHGRDRRVVHFTAHGPVSSGCVVSMEWTGGREDNPIGKSLAGLRWEYRPKNRNRLRKAFASYRDALAYAEDITQRTGAMLLRKLRVPGGAIPLVTASMLLPSMRVPVLGPNDKLVLDEIVRVEKVDGEFVDLDVDDASNFFGNGILSHNSIYSFRGANPEEFIRSSDLVDTGGKTGRFKTHMLQTNYRSGANIVEAAGKLIAHNSRQVPMVCVADPARRGNGSIYRVDVEDHQAGAEHAAEEIRSLVGGEGSTRGYGDFGVATRTNAEAYAYVMELMRRGIPFRSRVNPLRDRTAQALIRWMHLAQPSVGGEEQNDAVLRAHEVPGFMLDAEFGRRIQALSRQQREPSYLRVLQTSWNQVYEASQQWRNDKNVRAYVDAIETLREGNFSPVDLVNHVLELQGVGRGGGRSLIESLMDDIKSDAEAMAELTSELGSRPTDDDVRALAIAPVQPILSLLGAHEDVGGALAFVNKLQRAAQKIDRSGEESAHEPAVNVDTVHGWKGLETRHLFVPMAKGVFPHTKSMEDETELSEERRLGYVALTRGKDVVTVITPGKSHLGKPAGPSPFLDEACIAPLAQPVAPGEEQRAV